MNPGEFLYCAGFLFLGLAMAFIASLWRRGRGCERGMNPGEFLYCAGFVFLGLAMAFITSHGFWLASNLWAVLAFKCFAVGTAWFCWNAGAMPASGVEST